MRTSLIAVVALLVPSALYAQVGGAPAGSGAMGAPYGNGVQPTPSYTGTTGPSNVLLLSLNSVTSYDDNVFGISQSHLGDELLGLGPRLALLEQRGPVSAEIDYQPYFQFYQHLTGYDRVNQALAANVTFTLSSHFSVRVRDAFSDQTGNYQTESSQPLVPGLGPPTALTSNIYTPLAKERDNNSRLDLIYRGSSRTSVSFFGGYDQLTLTNQPSGVQSLLDTRSFTSGLQYAYRLSSHATFGMLYSFQVYEYQGVLPAGVAPRLVTHSSILSLGWQATPSVSLQVFGGPEYVPAQHPATGQASGPALPNTSSGAMWSWTAGGSLSKATEKTTLRLSGGRAVTDGGGFLGTVTNTYASVGVGRRLIRRWSANCNVTGSESRGLNYGFSGGKLTGLNGTVSLDHPLSEQLDARLSYTLTRQYASGSVPFGADLNHSVVSLTISYQLRKIPLGR
jgi:hypothetical protein